MSSSTDLGPGHGDGERLVVVDADRRANLDHGIEGDGAILGTGGDVDLGRGDDIDLMGAHRLGVVVRQGVLQGLVPSEARATEPGLEHFARRFALAEARNLDLFGDLAEGRIYRLVELLRVDLDGNLDLVPLEGLDAALHEGRSVVGVGALAGHPGKNGCAGDPLATTLVGLRGVAQPGSARALGARGREFESPLPDSDSNRPATPPHPLRQRDEVEAGSLARHVG